MVFTMPYFTKLISRLALFLVCGLGLMHTAAAEGIAATRAEGRMTAGGQIALSTRFNVQLPDQLKGALRDGVPIVFELNYDLVEPTFPAYRYKLTQLFGSGNSVIYRLSFLPLTGQYRVSVGTYASEYPSLDSALKGVGAIAGWDILASGTLKDYHPDEVRLNVRLQLSTRQLPKPFQINALTSKDWSIGSGWVPVRITRN